MFHIKDKQYYAGEIALNDLAQNYGTPLYVYSALQITQNYQNFSGALKDSGFNPGIYFAVKSNYNLAVLRHLKNLGAGADIVSGGEMTRALAAGIPADQIIFSGVAKTDVELRAALAAGIRQINLESAEELESLQQIARAMNVTVNCAVRINPDVDAGTHAKITTGTAENKFGVDMQTARRMFDTAKNGNMNLHGVAIHIGSQILDVTPFDAAFSAMAEFMRDLEQAGHKIAMCDIGGGIGVPYRATDKPADLNAFTHLLKKHFADFPGHIATAPGRLFVANAGVLITRVEFIKRTAHKTFVVVDAAMNDLMRPALYDAYHPIFPAQILHQSDEMVCDIVGGICESTDVFAKDRTLPASLKAGDLLVIGMAGAYGATMAGTYNARDQIAEVMVNGANHALVRQRWEIAEQLKLETIPEWL